MSMAGEATYLRRFTVKLVEIAAAGIGTAVSGYLVAYVTGHLSFFSFLIPTAFTPVPPQAISSAAAPRDSTSIEATVRAALASHDGSRAAPVVATPQSPMPASSAPASPETQASPDTQASATAIAPPLATAEIRSLPPVADADQPFPAEPEGWPSSPAPMGRLPAVGGAGRLPPQPPPANVNVFTALKHFF
jgi:hypothetical protein